MRFAVSYICVALSFYALEDTPFGTGHPDIDNGARFNALTSLDSARPVIGLGVQLWL